MSSVFDDIGDDGLGQLDEDLRKWFKEKWVRFGPDGKIRGACARGSDSEGKPKCLPQKKAQNLGKKGRKYAAAKKRREDPDPERTGPAKNVATKKKTTEEKKPEFMKAGNMKPFTASGKEIPGSVSILEKLLVKAREHGIKLNYANIDEMMQAVAKKHHLTGDELHNEFVAKHRMIPDDWIVKQLDEACWKGYHKEGNKKMFGKTYPNCVKNTNEEQELDEKWSKKYKDSISCSNPKGFSQKAHCAGKRKNEDMNEEKCPECGGPMYHESMMNEKQDACYHKVKSRYKVWPSAYASGALVQCRKKGASNWGTGGKKDESSVVKGIVDEAGSPAQQAAIAIAMKKAGKKPKNESMYTASGDAKLPMEEAYRKAREITKQIQYDQTVSDILVSIQLLAKKVGIPNEELQYAENEVYTAVNALESAIYGLDEVFKDALERQRQEQDDEDFMSEDKAKQYVKPYKDPQTGEQIGWKSSDGRNVKYWRLTDTAKVKACQHAKISPDEVQEDNNGMYAAEKTPESNPYGGQPDRRFRGAISEIKISDTNTDINQTGDIIKPEHDEAYETLKRVAPKLYRYIRNEAPVPLDPILTLNFLRQMRGNEEAVLQRIKQELSKDTKAMYGNDYPALAESMNRFWKKVLTEMPDTAGPIGTQPGGWRKYRPKSKMDGVVKKESSIMKGLRKEGK
jgi:hypothetical protein